MDVSAPNESYSGVVGKDVFVEGVCKNASESQRDYYQRHGYTINDDTPEDQTHSETSRDAWKKADWVTHATTLGIDASNLTVDEIKAAVQAIEHPVE